MEIRSRKHAQTAVLPDWSTPWADQHSRAILLDFWLICSDSSSYDCYLNLCVIGDKGVGKSSFVAKFAPLGYSRATIYRTLLGKV